MARNISKESLEQKIEKAISKNREQYDRLTAELEELHKKQKAIQSEELLKAIEGSSNFFIVKMCSAYCFVLLPPECSFRHNLRSASERFLI